jgi:hypothetical protein
MASTVEIQGIHRQARPIPLMEARMQRAIARIAETDCPVLIVGEHGSGKRSIAELIHARSSRSRGAFKEIRCGETSAAALAADLSTEGTVYLAEVTDLSLSLQELILDTCFLLFEPRTSGSRQILADERGLLLSDFSRHAPGSPAALQKVRDSHDRRRNADALCQAI